MAVQTIDTHIHLTDFTKKDLTNLIEPREKVIAVSTSEKDWEKLKPIFEHNSEKIIPAFGLHPWYVRDASSSWPELLEGLLIEYPKAIIGEIGLDGIKDDQKEPQASAFKTQIDLAKKYNRPMLIHAVKSQDWLEDFWNFLPPEKFVFHSYRGKKELLQKIISHGGYISFSPSILKGDKDDIISLVPSNRILVETDAPYQGKPEDLEKVIEKITRIKNISAEDIYKNTLEFLS